MKFALQTLVWGCLVALGCGDLQELQGNLVEKIDAKFLWPGWTSYFGFNYETATALGALRHSPINQDISPVLENGQSFPHPGYWIKKGYPVVWFYSTGDRIGLFGDLYRDTNNEIYCYAKTYTREWPEFKKCKTRYLGWGPLLGLRLSKVWVWADDIYMSGALLIQDHPDELLEMLNGAKTVLKDQSDQLWWHGVKIEDDETLTPNGVKWGRANAWVLLTLARYVSRTNGDQADFLKDEVENFLPYQRPSGAFGNIVDDAASPDETSLTSVYVYAVGVLSVHGNATVNVVNSALAAYNWLNTREVEGLDVGDTCAGAHLSDDPGYYNDAVGLSEGPAIGLMMWAIVGHDQLTNPNATEFRPWDLTLAPECPEISYSPVFYFLSITGCILTLASCGLCCVKCACCIRCRHRISKPCQRCRGQENDTNGTEKVVPVEEQI